MKQQLFGTTIEYKLAPHMVVFSHGFGVRRDGRGMLTEIAENLPDGYGYVLFDYNEIDDEHYTVRIKDFSEQVELLNKVLAWTSGQKGVRQVSLIAHSMGCIVAALARPQGFNKVVFLAPPTSIGERTRKYFTGKRDAEKHGDTWVIPRSDGTISIIPESFFDQYEQVDALQALQQFADTQPYTLIVAGTDEVLPDADYEALAKHKNVQFSRIKGASHDFENDARQPLLDKVVADLTKAL